MNQILYPSFTQSIQASIAGRLHGYLDGHGPSLDALLRQARAEPNVAEVDALRGLASRVHTAGDAKELVIRIRSCLEELLCAIGEPLVEIKGAHSEPDFDQALRWHAARLTDLERDLKLAFRI
ncbi:hypothetical protein [Sediminimonas qiaohouensis]|uniref:hypothetical protein n=1 Tax=Sediminimonas qiaohouensis TaxID=552061 RepID=UPI00047A4438|nr:hypothetical protein [Sediminimonas qiaohouensis]